MANDSKAAITVTKLRELFVLSEQKVEDALPRQLKGSASRFIQISLLAFATSKSRDKLEMCDPTTYVQAFLDACSGGFPLDNKNAYAIPYGRVVTCSFDYKAIITAARRAGAIVDARAQEVCEGDEFDWFEQDGKRSYRFRMAEDEDNRGPVKGAFAVAVLPGGVYRFEYMPIKELLKVRKASKSPDSPAWVNWLERMYCKAVMKRVLQGLEMDSSFGRMLDIDNSEYELDRIVEGKASETRVKTYDDLADALHESAPVQAIEHKPEPVPLEAAFGVAAAPVPVRTATIPPRSTARPSIGSHPAGSRG